MLSMPTKNDFHKACENKSIYYSSFFLYLCITVNYDSKKYYGKIIIGGYSKKSYSSRRHS